MLGFNHNSVNFKAGIFFRFLKSILPTCEATTAQMAKNGTICVPSIKLVLWLVHSSVPSFFAKEICSFLFLIHNLFLLQELRNPPTGTGTSQGELTATSWPYYEAMDAVLGERDIMSPPETFSLSDGIRRREYGTMEHY